MVARRLDDVIRTAQSDDYHSKDIMLTRRNFLKFIGFTALSIGTGIGFAGCSGGGASEQDNVELKPPNPFNTGYKLIYPKWTKPVPDEVIPHIIEIGKKHIHVWAPGDLTCYVKGIEGDIPAMEVKAGMVIFGFSSAAGYSWLIGDDTDFDRVSKYIKVQYFKDLSRFIEFVNNNMSLYGAIFIMGVSGDKVYCNFTFIEQGGGKVASCVGVHDIKNPRNSEFYAFHDKNKLDNMMIEILSHPTGYKPGNNPKKWYTTPDTMYKLALEGKI